MNDSQIEILYGVKKLEPVAYKLYRIPGKWTWFNWFPTDSFKLETEYGVITGEDFNLMLYILSMAHIKVEVVNECI
jgi:hypothetical protein